VLLLAKLAPPLGFRFSGAHRLRLARWNNLSLLFAVWSLLNQCVNTAASAFGNYELRAKNAAGTPSAVYDADLSHPFLSASHIITVY